jgi:hypothetical protein
MSKVIANTMRHTGGSADNITLDNSQNVTVEGNATVDGTSTLTGNVTCSGQLKTDAIRHTGASSDAITLASDGTATAKITNYPHRNILINGDMKIAQRGTSGDVASGGSNIYACVDRWKTQIATGTVTLSQESTGTSDAPYQKGHRKYLRVKNKTGVDANAAQYIQIEQYIEAQDIAACGWDYRDSNSKITLSFWVRSSIAQKFNGFIISFDGTTRLHPFEITNSGSALTADTWTKVSTTFGGSSDVVIDDNNETGLRISLVPFYGSNYTNSTISLTDWSSVSGGIYMRDFATTWATTTNATFDFTGVQLEVGDTATDFEHRSYGDELARCQRYHYVHVDGDVQSIGIGAYSGTATVYIHVPFPVTMRATPTMTVASDGSNYWYTWYSSDTSNAEKGDNFAINGAHPRGAIIKDPSASGTNGAALYGRTSSASAKISFSAEL